MNTILDDILNGLAFAGNVLDTPWAAVRTAIADQDVGAGLESIVDWDKRASGKEMLNSLFGEFQGDELAGIAAEILPDILVPGMGAYKLLRRFRGAPALAEAAPEGRGFLDAIDKAVPAARAPEALAEPELMRLLGSNPIIESAESMPLALSAPETAVAAPYYSRLRNAAEALPGENIKGQSLINQLKRHAPEGVSDDEIAWANLSPLTSRQVVSKSDLVGYLDESLPEYSPTWVRKADDAKWGAYRTGSGDYSEHVAHLPYDRGGDNYWSPHWDEANPLVHVRTEMVPRSGGGKTLLANEIQSDWHQAGAKHGYLGSQRDFDIEKAQDRYVEIMRQVNEANTAGDVATAQSLQQEADALAQAIDNGWDETLERFAPHAVPPAPFKKDWPLLGIKELIRQGVEQGADEVAWLPGEAVQAMVGGGLKGQKKFYDDDLVNTANKYLKSRGWNTKVDRGHPVRRGSIKFDGEEATETVTIPFRIKITPEMRADLRKRGQPLMSLAPFGLGGGLAASLFGRPQSPTPES